ncbi:MAG: electron transfer flavoprotein subunit alpha/FixB family protein, partial [Pseudomonadota bacterium]
MAVLVIADHTNDALGDATNKTVTAATKFGGDVDVLVAGEGAANAAAEAAKIDGVRKVLHVEAAPLKKQLAEAMEALIVPMMDGYDALFVPATTMGKNVAPRIAAKLDVMQLSDVIGIEGQDTFVRPIYAGNAIMTVTSSDAKKVVTIRGTAFDAAGTGNSAPVEQVSGEYGAGKSQFVSEAMTESDRPELTAAKRIVSGGRALG